MPAVGELFIGGGPLDGRIVDLVASPSPDGAELRWVHADAPGFDGYLVVAIDGDPAAILPAGADRYHAFGLDDGEHRAEVLPFRQEFRRLPDLHGREPWGRRAYLRWPASTSADCRGYRLYSNGGSGPVNLATPYASTQGVVLHPLRWALPTTGTGRGRVSVVGIWPQNLPTNAAYSITIGSGTWSHNIDSAPALPIARGATYELPRGLRVTFHDAPADYTPGDVYTFQVGPPTSITTGELAVGTWRFQVSPVDAAGNEGAPIAEHVIAIIHAPDELENLRATWDGAALTLLWGLPPGADFSAIEVYSNYSNAFQRLMPHIIEDSPWQSLAGTATQFVLANPAAGLWRLYARARDQAGRRGASIQAVEVDTAGPRSDLRLNVPELISATPVSGGRIQLSWRYQWRPGGDDAESFRVFVGEDPLQFDVATATVPAVDTGDAFGVYTWTSDPLPGPRLFTVRAAAGGAGPARTTTNTGTIEGIPDATAPALSGPLQGVAT
jgi:hypothetical protein